MNCRQAKKLIFEHIDGKISDQDRLGLEQHLSECGSCEAVASGLSESLNLLHRLPPVEPDENFNWKLRLRLAKERNALQASIPSERSWFKAWNTRFALSAVSTFVLVLAVGFVLLRSAIGPDVSTTPSGISWEKMPPVAVDDHRRTDESRARDVPIGFGTVQPVVLGDQFEGPPVMGMSDPMLDVDSLMARFYRSRMEAYRIQQLEKQVELLQTELQKCNLERK